MSVVPPTVVSRLRSILVFTVPLAISFALGGFFFGGASSTSSSTASQSATAEVWTCSMHPQIRKPEAGSCPICGMDLILESPTHSTSSNPDRVFLSERARTLARLRTTPVSRQSDQTAEIHLLGRIEPDETTRKNVTTWVGGRIDKLHVNVTGEKVRAGQVVATLYSPEVYGAHQDLLTAAGQVARLSGSAAASQQAAQIALEAARERLLLLGVPEGELSKMEAATKPTRAVPIRTPFAGTVIERVATEGSYVQTGAPLYRIADLDRLWVQLDAYESDLPRLALGQTVALTVEGVPGQTFEGTIAFIDPTLDPKRRTARVRVEVKNPEHKLRTGMFAEAVVSSDGQAAGEAPLVVPVSAALFTGKRSIVYVEVEDESNLGYEPRTVRLGPRLGGVYPVVAGLSEGERVVNRGAFAIDADLQIRGGASMMSSTDDADSGEWDQAIQLPNSERDKLTPIVQTYLSIQQALAKDDLSTAKASASALETLVATTELAGSAAPPWAKLATELRMHAQHIAASSDLPGARGGFEPLSGGIESLLRQFGNPLGEQLHLAFCPMAQGDQGAKWVQQGASIDNAYFGPMMRDCGEIRAAIQPGAFLPAPTHAGRNAPAGHVH